MLTLWLDGLPDKIGWFDENPGSSLKEKIRLEDKLAKFQEKREQGKA